MQQIRQRPPVEALKFVEQLLDRPEEPIQNLPKAFSLADVQNDAVRFKAELELVARASDRFPTVRVDDGSIPVSLALLGPGGLRPEAAFDASDIQAWAKWYRFAVEQIGDGLDNFPLKLVSTHEAKDSFLSRAADFLELRMKRSRDWLKDDSFSPEFVEREGWIELTLPPQNGQAALQVPGCVFKVFTNTPNLSVYWSGAYYLTPNFFGHPTSPAQGPLQAGTYVFGITGGTYGSSVHWDRNSVCTLPGKPSAHVNY